VFLKVVEKKKKGGGGGGGGAVVEFPSETRQLSLTGLVLILNTKTRNTK